MSEEIIIDGTIYNKCNGCPLYDGNICTGARLDEGTSEKDTNICNKHLAEQFWVVQRQLKLKQQECKEINLTNERLVTEKYALNEEILRFKNEINRYKQALDDIEEIAKYNNLLVRDPFCGSGYRDLSGQILDIINKIKGA